MSETLETAQVATEIYPYKFTVLGFWFEEVKASHIEGVGLMLSRETAASLMERLTIVRSIFSYKKIHKAIWIYPNHCYESRIDHITMCTKLRSVMRDVRVYRGMDMEQVHHLYVIHLR
uniref:Uncharacterized protein n=1 Tax=Octopus bimaculoides TaxID=37653 RepID=A0A0L8HW61_OCTBM